MTALALVAAALAVALEFAIVVYSRTGDGDAALGVGMIFAGFASFLILVADS